MKNFAFILTLLVLSFPALADKPIIISVQASAENEDGERAFVVTLQHHDEGWGHYADRFEIIQPNGLIISRQNILRPHVDKQPISQTQKYVKIPKILREVHIFAHDSRHGYGMQVLVEIPHADEEIDFKN